MLISVLQESMTLQQRSILLLLGSISLLQESISAATLQKLDGRGWANPVWLHIKV
jgi:hypothetical protein